MGDNWSYMGNACADEQSVATMVTLAGLVTVATGSVGMGGLFWNFMEYLCTNPSSNQNPGGGISDTKAAFLLLQNES